MQRQRVLVDTGNRGGGRRSDIKRQEVERLDAAFGQANDARVEIEPDGGIADEPCPCPAGECRQVDLRRGDRAMPRDDRGQHRRIRTPGVGVRQRQLDSCVGLLRKTPQHFEVPGAAADEQDPAHLHRGPREPLHKYDDRAARPKADGCKTGDAGRSSPYEPRSPATQTPLWAAARRDEDCSGGLRSLATERSPREGGRPFASACRIWQLRHPIPNSVSSRSPYLCRGSLGHPQRDVQSLLVPNPFEPVRQLRASFSFVREFADEQHLHRGTR